MTKDELAGLLNGCTYRNEIGPATARRAKAAGLVVVFGASDDLMEFRGAIDEEISCYGGTTVSLTSSGLLPSCDNEDCPYMAKAAKEAATIDACWCEDDNPRGWSYRTKIPHIPFDVFEDGMIECRGIVFALADVAP